MRRITKETALDRLVGIAERTIQEKSDAIRQLGMSLDAERRRHDATKSAMCQLEDAAKAACVDGHTGEHERSQGGDGMISVDGAGYDEDGLCSDGCDHYDARLVIARCLLTGAICREGTPCIPLALAALKATTWPKLEAEKWR